MVLPINDIEKIQSTILNADNLKTGKITAEKIVANDIYDNFGNKFVTFRDLEYYHNKLMNTINKEHKNFTCMFDGDGEC